jgi:methionine aminopeptidase
MYDQRHSQTSIGGHGHASGAAQVPSPGKHTRTEALAHAAGVGGEGGGKTHSVREAVKRAMEKAGEVVVDKAKDKITESIEKFIESIFKDIDNAAKHTIDDGLKKGKHDCLTQQQVTGIEDAINTRRMLAAFQMLKEFDKALMAEAQTLQGDGSDHDKADALAKHIKEALKALTDYGKEIHKSNEERKKLHDAVARCKDKPKEKPKGKPQEQPQEEPVPTTNPALKIFAVPQQFQKVPRHLPVAPSIKPPLPDHVTLIPTTGTLGIT